jgi:hypothetical protein
MNICWSYLYFGFVAVLRNFNVIYWNPYFHRSDRKPGIFIQSYHRIGNWKLDGVRPGDGGSKHIWNVGQFLKDCTAQHLRRQPSSYSSPWEPEISPAGQWFNIWSFSRRRPAAIQCRFFWIEMTSCVGRIFRYFVGNYCHHIKYKVLEDSTFKKDCF